MFEKSHQSNLFSLIAPEDESPTMFKWDNNFSWAYNGNITDSMKELVKSAGGKVDGVLRFSIMWHHNNDDNSDYDAHCITPTTHIYFGRKNCITTRGNLDVDITNPKSQMPNGAVENITFPSLSKMVDGNYEFYVHQYRYEKSQSFEAEIEFDGTIYSYKHDKELSSQQKVHVATVNLKDNNFSIKHHLPESQTQQNIWGLNTNNFVKVKMMMYSPNHWDQQEVGNKHYFFVLDGCVNEDTPRGFFNEFLNDQLTPHKRVFEALGSKMKVSESDNQLSGLGFSSTQKNHVIVKVDGNFSRTLKVMF